MTTATVIWVARCLEKNCTWCEEAATRREVQIAMETHAHPMVQIASRRVRETKKTRVSKVFKAGLAMLCLTATTAVAIPSWAKATTGHADVCHAIAQIAGSMATARDEGLTEQEVLQTVAKANLGESFQTNSRIMADAIFNGDLDDTEPTVIEKQTFLDCISDH